MDKIIPVFKPVGFSTYDLIRVFKTKTNYKGKIGHAGTLDPFACGMVLLLLGKETKKFEEIKKLEKVYLAGIKLGSVSNTGDPEGKIQELSQKKPKNIEKALSFFTGEIEQEIPMFSASKHKGVPLYKLARKGKQIRKTKKVNIRKIELLKYKYPFLCLRVFCSGGTYIRQLAKDIGEKLGTGAYLFSLYRERIGGFDKMEKIV